MCGFLKALFDHQLILAITKWFSCFLILAIKYHCAECPRVQQAYLLSASYANVCV